MQILRSLVASADGDKSADHRSFSSYGRHRRIDRFAKIAVATVIAYRMPRWRFVVNRLLPSSANVSRICVIDAEELRTDVGFRF